MDRFFVENFRCFRERQEVRLAPLTLLVGENSTGKTSFMALIRALSDFAYRGEIPDFKVPPYDLGSFDEIAHHRGSRGGQAISFSAGFEADFIGRTRFANPPDGRFGFDVDFTRRGTAPFPMKRRISVNDVWIEEKAMPNGPLTVSFGTGRGCWEVHATGNDARQSSPEFEPFRTHGLWMVLHRIGEGAGGDTGVLPIGDSPTLTPKDRADIEQVSMLDFWPFVGQTLAGAPVHSKPQRTYDPAPPRWDPEGAYVPMYLADLFSQNNAEWKRLKKELERFGKKAGLFDEITIQPWGKKGSAAFQVQVRKFGRRLKGPRRNLIDVGYGVSQVLPVITDLLRADARPQILSQQPEVHLHPSAQAGLADLFCSVAGPERQLIIETHSDYIVDRVRMNIRDRISSLRPDDISLLYFERHELETKIHNIHFDRQGNVHNAPKGYREFFLKEINRSLGLT